MDVAANSDAILSDLLPTRVASFTPKNRPNPAVMKDAVVTSIIVRGRRSRIRAVMLLLPSAVLSVRASPRSSRITRPTIWGIRRYQAVSSPYDASSSWRWSRRAASSSSASRMVWARPCRSPRTSSLTMAVSIRSEKPVAPSVTTTMTSTAKRTPTSVTPLMARVLAMVMWTPPAPSRSGEGPPGLLRPPPRSHYQKDQPENHAQHCGRGDQSYKNRC